MDFPFIGISCMYLAFGPVGAAILAFCIHGPYVAIGLYCVCAAMDWTMGDDGRDYHPLDAATILCMYVACMYLQSQPTDGADAGV